MCSRFWPNWSKKAWCVSLIDDLRKFSSRSRLERGLFLEACVLLGVMRASILLFPFRRITNLLGLAQCNTSSMPGSDMTDDPSTIGWAVQAAAARTPWESACLVQALTGMIMLSHRGIGATLYLGVSKDENNPETMTAHAWLRCGDTILIGAGGVERFSVISSFSRPPADSMRRQPDNDRTGP
jgi:hypothetical protein